MLLHHGFQMTIFWGEVDSEISIIIQYGNTCIILHKTLQSLAMNFADSMDFQEVG